VELEVRVEVVMKVEEEVEMNWQICSYLHLHLDNRFTLTCQWPSPTTRAGRLSTRAVSSLRRDAVAPKPLSVLALLSFTM